MSKAPKAPKAPKVYIISWTRYRMSETTVRYYSGTLARFCQFIGLREATRISQVVKRWQKQVDYEFGCTYTSVCVERVDVAPVGATVTELT